MKSHNLDRLSIRSCLSIFLLILLPLFAGCGGGKGGTTTTSTTTTVALKSVSMGTGDSHTCTSLPDHSVRCWGDNTYGQLGVDWALPRAFSPLSVPGVSAVSAVTDGGVHTCVLLQNGTVNCWGSNVGGQLGNNTYVDSFTPVAVSGLSTATAITASRTRMDAYGHTCALLSDKTVQCWGRNTVGQLGDGTTINSPVPVAVSVLTGVTAVQAGGFHTCAVRSDKTVWCWGDNGIAQLGDGTTTTPRMAPVQAIGVTNATALALGGDFSCALISNGTVQCWGGNGQGRLGDGLAMSGNSVPVTTPVTVTGISTATAIAAGRGHACALLSNGTVKCWGDNSAGMLGNGTTTNSSTPLPVTGITNAISLSAGAVHTCARLADTTVKCWGDNASGQIGPGSTTTSSTPAAVLSASPSTPLNSVNAAKAGSLHGCSLTTSGTVSCWGNNGLGQLGSTAFSRSSTANMVSGVAAASTLTTGGWHTCSVLTVDGSISCWGENLYGQLGDGTGINSSIPVKVIGIKNGTTTTGGSSCSPPRFCPAVVTPTTTTTTFTKAIAAGSARTCALINLQISGGGACPVGGCTPTISDIVQCWGDNDKGQLGNGTTSATPSLTPVTVSTIATASAITGGYNHACALLASGSVQCWGANYSGQLGDGTLTDKSTPVTVTGFTNATKLSDGSMNDHSCAVISGGTVKCWGDNTLGQLGNGTLANSSTPVLVSGITNATAVATGYGHSCALLSDTTVKCWGWNILGQLGNGTSADSSVPVAVTGLTGATGVTVGFAQSCATIAIGGGVKCWGDNSYAQLGLGVLAVSLPTPTSISVVSRMTAGGHTFPSCTTQLNNLAGACVLDGNLVIRTGMGILVFPLPPE